MGDLASRMTAYTIQVWNSALSSVGYQGTWATYEEAAAHQRALAGRSRRFCSFCVWVGTAHKPLMRAVQGTSIQGTK